MKLKAIEKKGYILPPPYQFQNTNKYDINILHEHRLKSSSVEFHFTKKKKKLFYQNSSKTIEIEVM